MKSLKAFRAVEIIFGIIKNLENFGVEPDTIEMSREVYDLIAKSSALRYRKRLFKKAKEYLFGLEVIINDKLTDENVYIYKKERKTR